MISQTPRQDLQSYLGPLPESFEAAETANLARTQDSLVLFYLTYPSRQGTVAAFQEWLSVADRSPQSSPLKGVGKKAVEFRAAMHWVVFYSNKTVFGVGHPDSSTSRNMARNWAEDQF